MHPCSAGSRVAVKLRDRDSPYLDAAELILLSTIALDGFTRGGRRLRGAKYSHGVLVRGKSLSVAPVPKLLEPERSELSTVYGQEGSNSVESPHSSQLR